jgi:hypothetical protein
MTETEINERAPVASGGEARELQARLYRELGLLAVATALDVGLDRTEPAEGLDAAGAPASERRAA